MIYKIIRYNLIELSDNRFDCSGWIHPINWIEDPTQKHLSLFWMDTEETMYWIFTDDSKGSKKRGYCVVDYKNIDKIYFSKYRLGNVCSNYQSEKLKVLD